MTKELRNRIIIIYIFVVIAVAIGYGMYANRLVYNPEGVHGNTTGNLNNNGMFCEYDGKIYFANPYDRNRLYVMNSDCTAIKKLNSDSVSSINVYGKYIYYIRNNFSEETAAMIFRGQLLGVIRTNLKGEKMTSLYDSVAGVINLYGNDIYYQHYSDDDGLSFYKMNIDGKNNERLSDNGYYPSCIYNDTLYYSNVADDHNIYAYNLANRQAVSFISANTYMPDMQGDYIYYIDLDTNYSLVRVNTHTQEKQVLHNGMEGRCINYNLYGNVIFYNVENDNPALYRMNTDGSNIELIKSGSMTNVSCTSTYTFFQLFGTTSLYRVPTTGPVNVELIRIE